MLKPFLPAQCLAIKLYQAHDGLQNFASRTRKHFQDLLVHHHLVDNSLEIPQGANHFFLMLL